MSAFADADHAAADRSPAGVSEVAQVTREGSASIESWTYPITGLNQLSLAGVATQIDAPRQLKRPTDALPGLHQGADYIGAAQGLSLSGQGHATGGRSSRDWYGHPLTG